MSEKLMIGKQEYEVEEKLLAQSELSFYSENPRVYSALNVADGVPEQDEIEELMTGMEHVKQLKVSIEANGGLIDPLIVRDGKFTVLEGNSRLAAYRLLAKQDPIKWSKVKCKVLPESISDSAIFTLLGQYHIIGRKDWSPFEQAGYLYRRTKTSKVPIDCIAEELGISKGIANKFIEVYSFMVEKNDLKPLHWSYYDEYLKNNAIKSFRKTNADLDDTVVEQIKTEQIAQATDIRNKLGAIAKVSTKTSKKVMAEISKGKISIYEGFNRVEDTGRTGDIFNILNRFRTKISEKDFPTKLKNGDLDATRFELKKIKTIVDKLMNELDR